MPSLQTQRSIIEPTEGVRNRRRPTQGGEPDTPGGSTFALPSPLLSASPNSKRGGGGGASISGNASPMSVCIFTSRRTKRAPTHEGPAQAHLLSRRRSTTERAKAAVLLAGHPSRARAPPPYPPALAALASRTRARSSSTPMPWRTESRSAPGGARASRARPSSLSASRSHLCPRTPTHRTRSRAGNQSRADVSREEDTTWRGSKVVVLNPLPARRRRRAVRAPDRGPRASPRGGVARRTNERTNERTNDDADERTWRARRPTGGAGSARAARRARAAGRRATTSSRSRGP